jgi:hypothetical protein
MQRKKSSNTTFYLPALQGAHDFEAQDIDAVQIASEMNTVENN